MLTHTRQAAGVGVAVAAGGGVGVLVGVGVAVGTTVGVAVALAGARTRLSKLVSHPLLLAKVMAAQPLVKPGEIVTSVDG